MFVHDRQTGLLQRVSVTTSGIQGDGYSGLPALSGDGRCVVFLSQGGSNLAPGMPDGEAYPVLRDCWTGVTTCVSYSTSGVPANHGVDYAESPRVSGDGDVVVFESYAWTLVSGDSNGSSDVFVRDRGATVAGFCFGDGGATPCPCGNSGALWKGCENSAGTGGAVLFGAGAASLASDTLVLTSSGERSSAPSLVLQGTVERVPANFGDGLLCAGGVLKRLYLRSAAGGGLTVPQTGDLSVSARSAALGDVIAPGELRCYQAYYRDPVPGFCAGPTGDNWNITSGLRVQWGP